MFLLFSLFHFFSLYTCNSILLVSFFSISYYLSCRVFIETGSDDDGNIDVSEDDFFMEESSSDEDADDEWTDKSARYNEHALIIMHNLCRKIPFDLFLVSSYHCWLLQPCILPKQNASMLGPRRLGIRSIFSCV